MKSFQFSLQSVLDYRGELEESKSLVYQEIQQEKQAVLQEIEQLNRQLEELVNRLESGERLTVVELQQGYRYQTQLNEWLLELQRKLEIVELRLSKAFQDWIKARQDVQVMEKLKEKQYEAYQEESNRLEAMQLEEYAILRR